MQPAQPNRSEAERLLGVAEKLLHGKDFNGSRDFAILAQETEPLLEGSEQILAVADVLMAGERRINNHQDWYAVLQVDRRSDDLDLIKRQYRRLAFLLHPDKNKLPFAAAAFRLVADAWQVLSDPRKKSLYDNELSLFSKVDLVAPKTNRRQDLQDQQQHHKLPVRRSGGGSGTRKRGRPPGSGSRGGSRSGGGRERARAPTFWTVCPYCYNLYEYPTVYRDCCLRCQKCERAFHGAVIQSLPPLVPGKEAYYCCWGFFPMGFSVANSEGAKKGFPNWVPPMFSAAPAAPVAKTVPNIGRADGGRVQVEGFAVGSKVNVTPAKKRGRPRKYVQA